MLRFASEMTADVVVVVVVVGSRSEDSACRAMRNGLTVSMSMSERTGAGSWELGLT